MASKKHTMKLIDPSKWSARELVAPDGRTFTPSTFAEERNLIAAYGYKAVPEEPKAAEDENLQAAPEAGDVQSALTSEGKSGSSRKATSATATSSEGTAKP